MIPFPWRLRAALAALIIPVLVNSVSFAAVAKMLTPRRTRRRAQLDDDVMANWVTSLLHRLPDPWYPTCLRRAAVLYYLLRRAGRPVHLCVGVQRGAAGNVDAHAWLVYGTAYYLEPSTTDPSLYKVIARFPEDSTAGIVEKREPLEISEV